VQCAGPFVEISVEEGDDDDDDDDNHNGYYPKQITPKLKTA
jgi:hypothetical protein